VAEHSPTIDLRGRGCRIAAAMLLLLCSGAIVHAAEQRLPRSQYKSGVDVRKAFRDVVDASSRATVSIACDGRTTALGAIVSADGGVLTKASQLSGQIVCRLRDGRELDARIVGVHEKLDLAYLQLDATELPVVPWENGSIPNVGQWLATVGTEEIPVAVGVVSVQKRRLPEQRGVLGVQVERSSDGPRVVRVLPMSAAEKIGLKEGDIIHRVAGASVADENQVADAIGGHEPGETVELEITRGSDRSTLRATLGHPAADLLSRGGFMNHLGGRLSRRRSGFPSVLQHDTVLSPEQCGGPLVGLTGRVVGINIARAGRTETYALPAELILPVLADLKSGRLAPPATAEASRNEPAPPALPED